MFQLLIICFITVASWVDGFPGIQQPYGFSYNVKNPFGGEQHRQESGSGGTVQGSYGYTDNSGLYRQVQYVADQGGFRAQVKTNEPGTASKDPAAVSMVSSAHPYFGSGSVLGRGGGYAGKGSGSSRGYDQEWEKAAAAASQNGAGSGMSGFGGMGQFSKSGYGF